MAIPNECPKCRVGMKPVEEGNDVFLVCSICGYKRQLENITKRTCPACGCTKAIMNYVGVIIGDEPDVKIYKCIRCGKVEREGVS